MSNLEQQIEAINRQRISGHIWIDGSFLTEKLNPDDADIVLVISSDTLRNLTPSQRQFFDAFRMTSLYEHFKIDNYGVVLDPASPSAEWIYAYWLRQFGFSRSDKMKGIVRVSVPFLVSP